MNTSARVTFLGEWSLLCFTWIVCFPLCGFLLQRMGLVTVGYVQTVKMWPDPQQLDRGRK